LGREDLFQMCEGNHVVAYDPETAEPVCTICGLVFDDMKLDFLMDSNAVPKRVTVKPRMKSVDDGTRLDKSLLRVFAKRNIQKTVQERALELYNIVRKRHLQKGYSVSTLTGALIYAAHRLCHVPTTLKECGTVSTSERKKVLRCYRNLCEKMELNAPRLRSNDYLYYLAQKKAVDSETVAIARRILERAMEKRLDKGPNPVGVAVAALYIGANLTTNHITQRELAEAASVSEVTLRVNCNKLEGLLPNIQSGKR